MTLKEMHAFEEKLLSRGYKRWNYALYGTEDYDVSRLIRDEDGEDKYQIIYKFWNWTKYPKCPGGINEAAVDVAILPCFDGRADLCFSSFDKQLDVDWVESVAEKYYNFIMEEMK